MTVVDTITDYYYKGYMIQKIDAVDFYFLICDDLIIAVGYSEKELEKLVDIINE